MLIGTVVLALTAAALGFVWWPLALIVVPVLVFLFAFFRDPDRAVPVEQMAVVSPADGKVSDITEVENDPIIGGPAVRIGIFLSVFNVHVNRSPCDGKVIDVRYKTGKFINALKHDVVSDQNESNTIVMAEPNGTEPVVVVKQIVGLIARRIICTVNVNDQVKRGDRIGMIKFGSRTELTISKKLQPMVKCKVGQTVKGVVDVLAMLGEPIHTTIPASDTGTEGEPIVGRTTPA
ncbi:MAG TPA: phosphatidylserine decarboxylase [Tepidisphaeraceae bacterium]|nr:phosphatidylserine decarboxylase [Tepidisphaeraceae bacterium]